MVSSTKENENENAKRHSDSGDDPKGDTDRKQDAIMLKAGGIYELTAAACNRSLVQDLGL